MCPFLILLSLKKYQEIPAGKPRGNGKGMAELGIEKQAAPSTPGPARVRVNGAAVESYKGQRRAGRTWHMALGREDPQEPLCLQGGLTSAD